MQAIKQRGLRVIRAQVTKNSRLIDKTAAEVEFREWYGAAILAVQSSSHQSSSGNASSPDLSSLRFQDFEFLIVDDGSTDRTPEIAESFCAQDSRFSLLRQEHLGVSAARNLAIEKAGGTFIAPIDADDLWFPSKIQRQVELMHKGVESIGIVFSWGFIIDEYDSIIAAVGIPCALNSFYNFVYANSIGRLGSPLIRKECLKKVGLYDTRFVYGGEDWNLYIRISREFSVAYTPDYLAPVIRMMTKDSQYVPGLPRLLQRAYQMNDFKGFTQFILKNGNYEWWGNLLMAQVIRCSEKWAAYDLNEVARLGEGSYLKGFDLWLAQNQAISCQYIPRGLMPEGTAPQTGIYWCSVCKTPAQFKAGEVLPVCKNLCGRGRWEFVRKK